MAISYLLQRSCGLDWSLPSNCCLDFTVRCASNCTVSLRIVRRVLQDGYIGCGSEVINGFSVCLRAVSSRSVSILTLTSCMSAIVINELMLYRIMLNGGRGYLFRGIMGRYFLLGFWGKKGEMVLSGNNGVLLDCCVVGGEMEDNALNKVRSDCCKNEGKCRKSEGRQVRLLPLRDRMKISSLTIQTPQCIFPKNTQTPPKLIFCSLPYLPLFTKSIPTQAIFVP